jgi:ligand-binding sensor domain-containing protein
VGAADVEGDAPIAYSSRGPTADGRVKPDATGYSRISVATPEYERGGFVGTSAAAPHVAGMAALLWSVPENAALTADEVEARLLSFAADKGEPGPDTRWGAGLLRLPPFDVEVAVEGVSAVPRRLYATVAVRRSNGELVTGLLVDAFHATVGGRAAPVLTSREVGEAYLLEVVPPDGATARGLAVGALGTAATVEFDPPTPEDAPEIALHLATQPGRLGLHLPIPLLASVTDDAPLTGVLVSVLVRRPDGSTEAVSLHDDGQHGDGVADDGVYGGSYARTGTPGRYVLTATASGTRTTGEPFQERDALAVLLPGEAADGDGDGAPDAWERAHGLDPAYKDGYRDPDIDGLVNLEELRWGTDPRNWDSDGDGLSDGAERTAYFPTDPANADSDLGGVDDASELAQGSNPLDAVDDAAHRLPFFTSLVLRDHAPPLIVAHHAVARDVAWLATRHGAVRWRVADDRYRKLTAADGLPADEVTAVAVGEDGTTWFATARGVARLSGGRWTTYTARDGLAHDRAWDIALADDGTVWVATAGGVSSFDGETWASHTAEDGPAHDGAYAIVVDEEGRPWVGTRAGASVFDGKRWITYTTRDGLGANTVTSLAVDGAGNVWAGTWGGGASVFGGKASARWRTYGPDDGLADGHVTTITADALGRLWFHTPSDVHAFDGAAWARYPQDASLLRQANYEVPVEEPLHNWAGTRPPSTLPPEIRVVEELDDRPWFGITGRGAAGITYGTGTRLPVTAVEVGADGVWLGTPRGLSHLEGGEWRRYDVTAGLPGDHVLSLGRDDNGGLWVGTDAGAAHLDETNWVIHTPAQGLASRYVDAIATDGAGRLWLGAGGGHGGVSVLEEEGWTAYRREDGLADEHVNALLSDAGGRLWLGTDGGLNRFDGLTWLTYGEGDGLPDETVGSLALDARGWLWVGTGEGIARFDGVAWRSYHAEDGLPADAVTALAADPGGGVWLGTDRGVARFDGTTWRSYAEAEGWPAELIHDFAIEEDGGLWVATGSGVTEVRWQTSQP